MKVETKSTAIQLEAYLRQIRQKHPASGQQPLSGLTAQSDKVDLSDRAREVQQAAQMLKEMPDVREDKVQQVKMAVDNGTYNVIGTRVATHMLRESFENSFILNSIDQHV
jgi:negative regulator of flagellin synthesis FlgM